MTDEAKLIVNTLRACAVETQCSKCVVVCGNDECLFTAAAKMIESLAAELEQVKRERDAAVEDLRDADRIDCEHCASYDDAATEERCGDAYYLCDKCTRTDCPCRTCRDCSNWTWRGVREDAEADLR